jgi:transcriptional regulator with XRE-family HTH domain
MSVNPVSRIRKDLSLTQVDLARRARITEQVILKAEQGVYPTLPPSLLRMLGYLTGTPESQIEAEYEAWIDEQLKEVKLPSCGKQMVTDFVLFNEWRSTVCNLNGVPDNINSFCKLMKIHPYVIQKYSAGKMKGVPVQLIQRIGQIKGIG